jgi:hypothetical protein
LSSLPPPPSSLLPPPPPPPPPPTQFKTQPSPSLLPPTAQQNTTNHDALLHAIRNKTNNLNAVSSNTNNQPTTNQPTTNQPTIPLTPIQQMLSRRAGVRDSFINTNEDTEW